MIHIISDDIIVVGSHPFDIILCLFNVSDAFQDIRNIVDSSLGNFQVIRSYLQVHCLVGVSLNKFFEFLG